MSTRDPSTNGVFPFFAIACALTWLLATPLNLAWLHQVPPEPYALACAGLSAFGPLFAVLVVAGRKNALRGVFGRFRANPAWVVVALAAPLAIHVVATALSVLFGERPEAWLHPPSTPEHIAALVVFSLGEEFGWRGFAHPRLAERHGLVQGSLLIGALWGAWHLMYSVTPEGLFDQRLFAMNVVQCVLYAPIIAWVFERAQRGMAVALAFHAGGHLDNFNRVPFTELRLHAAHLVVLALVSAVAIRGLAKRQFTSSVAPVKA